MLMNVYFLFIFIKYKIKRYITITTGFRKRNLVNHSAGSYSSDFTVHERYMLAD